jgi:hypothetical protein
VSISNEKIAKGLGSALICYSSSLVGLDSARHESYPVPIHNWVFSTTIPADSDLYYFKEKIG